MEKIHVIARFKIHDGKLAEFKERADQCIEATKTEVGALLYSWYVDEKNNQCTVLETYKDSTALLIHADNVDKPLSSLMQVGDLTLEVYGNPTKELSKALMEMNLEAQPYYKGI